MQSIFGMNVDLLAENPDWKFYVWIAVPTLGLVFGTWLLIKSIPVSDFEKGQDCINS